MKMKYIYIYIRNVLYLQIIMSRLRNMYAVSYLFIYHQRSKVPNTVSNSVSITPAPPPPGLNQQHVDIKVFRLNIFCQCLFVGSFPLSIDDRDFDVCCPLVEQVMILINFFKFTYMP